MQNRMTKQPNNQPRCYCSTNRYRTLVRCNRTAVVAVGGPTKNIVFVVVVGGPIKNIGC